MPGPRRGGAPVRRDARGRLPAHREDTPLVLARGPRPARRPRRRVGQHGQPRLRLADGEAHGPRGDRPSRRRCPWPCAGWSPIRSRDQPGPPRPCARRRRLPARRHDTGSRPPGPTSRRPADRDGVRPPRVAAAGRPPTAGPAPPRSAPCLSGWRNVGPAPCRRACAERPGPSAWLRRRARRAGAAAARRGRAEWRGRPSPADGVVDLVTEDGLRRRYRVRHTTRGRRQRPRGPVAPLRTGDRHPAAAGIAGECPRPAPRERHRVPWPAGDTARPGRARRPRGDEDGAHPATPMAPGPWRGSMSAPGQQVDVSTSWSSRGARVSAPGAPHRATAAHGQLHRLLRRPPGRGPGDGRGRPDRRADRRLAGRADHVHPPQDTERERGLRADVPAPDGGGLPPVSTGGSPSSPTPAACTPRAWRTRWGSWLAARGPTWARGLRLGRRHHPEARRAPRAPARASSTSTPASPCRWGIPSSPPTPTSGRARSPMRSPAGAQVVGEGRVTDAALVVVRRCTPSGGRTTLTPSPARSWPAT